MDPLLYNILKGCYLLGTGTHSLLFSFIKCLSRNVLVAYFLEEHLKVGLELIFIPIVLHGGFLHDVSLFGPSHSA
jgi:hypothetical protein